MMRKIDLWLDKGQLPYLKRLIKKFEKSSDLGVRLEVYQLHTEWSENEYWIGAKKVKQ
jgi:hypothetical protein